MQVRIHHRHQIIAKRSLRFIGSFSLSSNNRHLHCLHDIYISYRFGKCFGPANYKIYTSACMFYLVIYKQKEEDGSMITCDISYHMSISHPMVE